MSRRVTYSPGALDQLSELYDYISAADAPASAERFVSSIVDFCEQLHDATVDVLGVFYAGRDVDPILAVGDDPATE